jgi:arginyl-tRNA--protein-N-Asp/Glu arginylyltransferase
MKEELGSRQFYLTPSHPCSYLPQREAQTLFLDPRDTIDQGLYQALAEQGFRRSGSHLYRPHCQNCQACIPTRIPVAEFSPRRSQRRVLAKNDDLTLRIEPASFQQHYYDLYASYLHGRHQDGDMFPPSIDQFRSFLLSQWSDTQFLCTYLGDELLAVAVTDQQPKGLSAIYTFFDPTYASRSLGVFSVLSQIEVCRSLDLPHLYLGYWIKDSPKMRYKTEYRPVELFVSGRWANLY